VKLESVAEVSVAEAVTDRGFGEVSSISRFCIGVLRTAGAAAPGSNNYSKSEVFPSENPICFSKELAVANFKSLHSRDPFPGLSATIAGVI
jgi:hypothetical protein